MRSYVKIVSVLFLFSLFDSCSKEKKVISPVIEIISPEYNQIFLLPDTINVNLTVTHTARIEYIRISIDNKNLTPLSEQSFIYPIGTTYQGNVQLELNIIPDIIMKLPYYVHIVVSDFYQLHHYYLEIELKNSDKFFKGFFLIDESSINRLTINHYDSLAEKMFDTIINGDFIDSDISSSSELLYINTTTPDLSRSFNVENGNLEWTQMPQLPYPEFTGITVDDNMIYLSTAIGRIIGLTTNDGLQVFTTLVLPDTIPNNVCVTNKYLLADFTLRHSQKQVWVSYYKQTGSKYQVFPTDYETENMYYNDVSDKMILFCNKQNTGQVITFDIETNLTLGEPIIFDNNINYSCRIDNDKYLFSSEKSIYLFNYSYSSFVKVYQTNQDIVDLDFDDLSNKVFIVQSQKLEIISYPDFNYITSVDSENILKSIELLYGY